MREVVDSSPTATRLFGYTCGLKKRDDKLITGFRLYKRIVDNIRTAESWSAQSSACFLMKFFSRRFLDPCDRNSSFSVLLCQFF